MVSRVEKALENSLIPVLIIAWLAIIVYSNSFTAPFTLDDFGSIVNNYAIRNPLDFSALWKFYSNRFVLYFSFSIDYFLYGTDVRGYHAVNLLIHIFNGILVYFIFLNILGLDYFKNKLPGRYFRTISIISALIFVCHPIQVNAVTYIVQRTASLAAMFYLLSILFFLKFRVSDKLRYFVITLFFIILAMFTKENTITIPFMLALIEFIFFLNDGKTSWLKRAAFLLVLLLTVPLIPGTNLLLHGYSQSDPGVSFKASTSMDRFVYFNTELNVIILYIKLLFIPNNQNFDYSNDFPLSYTIWQNHSYISFIILSIIFLIACINFKRNKLMSFGIFWFFIGLAVESSFISIKDVYFEHRVYFSLAGFIMFIVGFVFMEINRFDKGYLFKKPMLFFVLLTFTMLLSYSALTLKRNYIFSDSIRLWSDVVKKAPNSDRAHSVLGSNYLDAYENNNNTNKEYLMLAETELKKSIELDNNNDTAHCNLSKVYLLEKKYGKAIEEANTANKLNNSTYAYNNLGNAYKALKRTNEAIKAYLAGYNLDNKCTFILKDLGDIYFDINDKTNAKFYYTEFLKYNEDSENEDIQDKLEMIK